MYGGLDFGRNCYSMDFQGSVSMSFLACTTRVILGSNQIMNAQTFFHVHDVGIRQGENPFTLSFCTVFI
jgi:hypothetical protein